MRGKKIENERDTDRQRKRDPREIKRDNQTHGNFIRW